MDREMRIWQRGCETEKNLDIHLKDNNNSNFRSAKV